jgi:hypothetical protein
MKKEILFASYLMLCIIFGACDDENEVNQPPVIDKFEIEVTADGNTVFATIDYAVSDPEKEIESIILKKKMLAKTYFEKNLSSNSGTYKLDLSRNTPYHIQLIVTDGRGETVGQQIKVFVPLNYNS